MSNVTLNCHSPENGTVNVVREGGPSSLNQPIGAFDCDLFCNNHPVVGCLRSEVCGTDALWPRMNPLRCVCKRVCRRSNERRTAASLIEPSSTSFPPNTTSTFSQQT